MEGSTCWKRKINTPKKAGMHAKRNTTMLNMQYIRSIIHMYTYYDLHEYIYIQKHLIQRESKRERERERERVTERKRESQREREIERKTERTRERTQKHMKIV